ncbi:TonB family protein [Novosphingobium resinovorum]|uniref:energy transducer TonB n=1 Tax=Novosphingobium resinovorum TaxID=158500 RepID=UPI002ED2F57C|nr:TonB family protein [Novosphingobium resinovorum]
MTPDPVDPPKAQPEQPLVRDTPITAPKPKIDFEPRAPITGVTVDPLPAAGSSDLALDFGLPTTKPADPPARFAPKSAKPRGNVAGWVTTDDYPTADVRAGHTGTVRFRLAIDAGGRVTGCTVTQSSGFPGLDEATCRNVTRRARFDAASDAMGEKATGSYDGTIRWVIPND